MANDKVPTLTPHYNPDSKRQREGVRRRNARAQKDAQDKLGQPMAAARNKLYKIVVLEFAKRLGLHHCYQCGVAIDDPENLSIEHKEPWRNSDDPLLMFFSVENIAISHFGCNRAAGWKGRKKQSPKAIWGRLVSYERYHEALSYDEISGRLTWKIQSGCRLPGDLAGTRTKAGYLVVNVDGVQNMVHHVVWFMKTGKWSNFEIDHKNRRKHDNSWVNLREATKSQQQANKRPLGKYKKGVSKNSNCSTFQANIQVQGERIYLGCFKTEDEAHAAWLAAATENFGEFATAT